MRLVIQETISDDFMKALGLDKTVEKLKKKEVWKIEMKNQA